MTIICKGLFILVYQGLIKSLQKGFASVKKRRKNRKGVSLLMKLTPYSVFINS